MRAEPRDVVDTGRYDAVRSSAVPAASSVRTMAAPRQVPDRNLAMELVRVTEAAAIAASQ